MRLLGIAQRAGQGLNGYAGVLQGSVVQPNHIPAAQFENLVSRLLTPVIECHGADPEVGNRIAGARQNYAVSPGVRQVIVALQTKFALNTTVGSGRKGAALCVTAHLACAKLPVIVPEAIRDHCLAATETRFRGPDGFS